LELAANHARARVRNPVAALRSDGDDLGGDTMTIESNGSGRWLRGGAATRAAVARIARRVDAFRIPRPLPEPGVFEVDGTWGRVQPIELGFGVRTVGELDVAEQIARGRPLVDTRLPHFHAHTTIPGAVNIPHGDVLERLGELDPDVATIFFCNGPQCSATPAAVHDLLAAGYPPNAILYYRGGIHDWMTLGYPVAHPGGAA
jgi:rhodanese-related sulfurtransferase